DVFTASELLRLQQGAMSTALAQPMPADAATRANIEKLHKASDAAFRDTHERSIAEAGGPVPNLTRIRGAWRAYEKRYGEAMASLDKPLAARPANMQEDWQNSANEMVIAMNLRTRERSMYIADTSALNNELTKVIRLVWAVRETIGRDRRRVAEAIIKGEKLTSEQLQQFAEQDGNNAYPW